jgi:F-type H+-transporting ATPase subunit delta
MRGTRASYRYAKSLLTLAIEQNVLEEAYRDIKLLADICSQNRDFVVFLKSPIIKSDKKIKVINAVMNGRLSPITDGFIKIITNHVREGLLVEIVESFVAQYKEHKKIAVAEVISATKLDDVQRKKIAEAVKKAVGREVELTEKINENIIGGLIVRVGDQQFDASISRKLKELKKGFSKNVYVSQL